MTDLSVTMDKRACGSDFVRYDRQREGREEFCRLRWTKGRLCRCLSGILDRKAVRSSLVSALDGVHI